MQMLTIDYSPITETLDTNSTWRFKFMCKVPWSYSRKVIILVLLTKVPCAPNAFLLALEITTQVYVKLIIK